MEVKRTFDLLDWSLEKFDKEISLAGKENGKWVTYSQYEFRKIFIDKRLNRRQFLGAMSAMTAGVTCLAGCSSTVKISQMSNQVGGRPFNKPEKSRVEF